MSDIPGESPVKNEELRTVGTVDPLVGKVVLGEMHQGDGEAFGFNFNPRLTLLTEDLGSVFFGQWDCSGHGEVLPLRFWVPHFDAVRGELHLPPVCECPDVENNKVQLLVKGIRSVDGHVAYLVRTKELFCRRKCLRDLDPESQQSSDVRPALLEISHLGFE